MRTFQRTSSRWRSQSYSLVALSVFPGVPFIVFQNMPAPQRQPFPHQRSLPTPAPNPRPPRAPFLSVEGPGLGVSHAWAHILWGLLCLVPSLRIVGSGSVPGTAWVKTLLLLTAVCLSVVDRIVFAAHGHRPSNSNFHSIFVPSFSFSRDRPSPLGCLDFLQG